MRMSPLLVNYDSVLFMRLNLNALPLSMQLWSLTSRMRCTGRNLGSWSPHALGKSQLSGNLRFNLTLSQALSHALHSQTLMPLGLGQNSMDVFRVDGRSVSVRSYFTPFLPFM